MKTDVVLTMGECLAICRNFPKHVNPPTRGARHIPVTSEGEMGSKNKVPACRCDRWGHPCPGCTDDKQGQHAKVPALGNKEQR